jgi:RNA polymerase sigma-70 factor (ECF subfamily)
LAIRLDSSFAPSRAGSIATCFLPSVGSRRVSERGEHDDDHALAQAAARGDAAAVRRIDEMLADLGPAVRRVDASPAFADEVRQAVRVRLLVADGGVPRIAAYAGRGPLRAWLHVAAARIAIDLKRAQRPVANADEVLGELVAREPDAELRHLKTQYRAEFKEAIAAALAALPGRSRALLRLHYVDGMRLADIGALYKVHESTASRWIAQAAETVSDDARARLVARLALSRSELDSVARMIRSQLDLSIARILQSSSVR